VRNFQTALEKVNHLNYRATAAIIMMISYGHEGISRDATRHLCLICNSVSPEEDIYVELADKVMESFAIAGEPGAFLIDFFPFCMSSHLDISSRH
jgi:hypothetical protein